MRERPILFSSPMVRAILAGTKTQTRRVVKPPRNRPAFVLLDHGNGWWPYQSDDDDGESALCDDGMEHPYTCPYGRPGDRLWVRETFAAAIYSDGMRFVEYKADRSLSDFDGYDNPAGGRWRPSIHMPRWASRITLEITDVRVERLQDISEADAVAEGVRRGDCKLHDLGDGVAMFLDESGWFAPERYTRHNAPRHAFREAWETINGPESWVANPWLWVIEFKKLEQQKENSDD